MCCNIRTDKKNHKWTGESLCFDGYNRVIVFAKTILVAMVPEK